MDDTGLPLLPRGDAIFERLPSRALILEAVAPPGDDDGDLRGAA